MPGTVRLHRVLTAKPEKIYRAFLEPDAMAVEACYLGWQESGRNLARLVEPDFALSRILPIRSPRANPCRAALPFPAGGKYRASGRERRS